ncbi:hypothetical protein GCM10010360_11980 [Streptomyces nogalater]
MVHAVPALPLFRVRNTAVLYLIKAPFRAEKRGNLPLRHPLGGRKVAARRHGMSRNATGRDQ